MSHPNPNLRSLPMLFTDHNASSFLLSPYPALSSRLMLPLSPEAFRDYSNELKFASSAHLSCPLQLRKGWFCPCSGYCAPWVRVESTGFESDSLRADPNSSTRKLHDFRQSSHLQNAGKNYNAAGCSAILREMK